jgi:hypothetical protein
MTERSRLPNRRASEFINFESMNMRFTVSVSRDSSGKILELFCDNHKQGSAIGTLVRDSAILLSFALQYGADVDAIRRALCRDGTGKALGPIAQALDLLGGEAKP